MNDWDFIIFNCLSWLFLFNLIWKFSDILYLFSKFTTYWGIIIYTACQFFFCGHIFVVFAVGLLSSKIKWPWNSWIGGLQGLWFIPMGDITQSMHCHYVNDRLLLLLLPLVGWFRIEHCTNSVSSLKPWLFKVFKSICG